MFKPIFHFFSWLNDLLHRPGRVLLICGSLAFVSLVLGGGFFQLWSLNREQSSVREKIKQIKIENIKLEANLKKVKDPKFIEVEARNQFDLAEEGDLIFIFSDESSGDKGLEKNN